MPLNILKKFYGYDSFRTGQEELINGTLDKKDVLGIMPTSGGKSICYQIPAMKNDGVSLVISPLISLMKDQVDALNEIGIPATYINSSLPQNEQDSRLNSAALGKYKMVYIAPEKLLTRDFIEFTWNVSIDFIAIDEAHCISQWGHDFRPSYQSIPIFINRLPNRPTIGAYTATATPQIIEDIKSMLSLKQPVQVLTGFDRPNLYFGVKKFVDKQKYVLEYINNNKNDCGIIYCATRKEVEGMYNLLKVKNLPVAMYHGGMNPEERLESQEKFLYDKSKIMVATNAFGMGIDKSNVRFVIHHNMPKTMESYYQEAGRAGRDGEKSDCILLFSPQDVVKQKFLINQTEMSPEREHIAYSNLQNIVDYCNRNQCLRHNILSYFGEDSPTNCHNCSVCLDNRTLIDRTIEAQKILSCVYRMKQNFGSSMIAKTLIGSKDKKVLNFNLNQLSTYNIVDNWSEKDLKNLIMELVAEGYLEQTESKFPIIKLTSNSRSILKGEVKFFSKETVEKRVKFKDEMIHSDLFETLRSCRSELAKSKNVPPYVIFSDVSLKEMCAYLPETEDDMLNIKGVGQKKLVQYGEKFLELILDYKVTNNIEAPEKLISPKNTHSSKSAKPKTHLITYDLYCNKLSINDIALERELTRATILNHLFKCSDEDLDVNWDEFVDNDKASQIYDAIECVGGESLKTIKDALPEAISYDEIKIAIYQKMRSS